jgi:hypothetical protein
MTYAVFFTLSDYIFGKLTKLHGKRTMVIQNVSTKSADCASCGVSGIKRLG